MTLRALEAGHQVTCYTITEVLGQGGFGITYLAHDESLDRDVAIKEYFPSSYAYRHQNFDVKPLGPDYGEYYFQGLNSFLKEAKTLAKFSHENIVSVFSVFEKNSTAYMVMQYERGTNLLSLLKQKGRLEQAEQEQIFFPIFTGLERIHQIGFIHRDIKPANTYIRDTGSPVLIDFGSARQLSADKTGDMTTFFTPGYTSLEQYSASYGKQGPWTDIYSLAATMYQGITGKKVADSVDRSASVLRGQPDPLQLLRVEDYPGYDQNFLDAVYSGLILQAEKRPSSLSVWRHQFATGRSASMASTQESSGFTMLLEDATRPQPRNSPPRSVAAGQSTSSARPESAPVARRAEPAEMDLSAFDDLDDDKTRIKPRASPHAPNQPHQPHQPVASEPPRSRNQSPMPPAPRQRSSEPMRESPPRELPERQPRLAPRGGLAGVPAVAPPSARDGGRMAQKGGDDNAVRSAVPMSTMSAPDLGVSFSDGGFSESDFDVNTTVVTKKSSPSPRKNKTGIVVAGIAAVLLLGVGGWFVSQLLSSADTTQTADVRQSSGADTTGFATPTVAPVESRQAAQAAQIPQPVVATPPSTAAVATVGSSSVPSTLTFDEPLSNDVQSSTPRSIRQLAEATPLFPPVAGLSEEYWAQKSCSNCHNWTRENLCTQAEFYRDHDITTLSRTPHPFGGLFKNALKTWVLGGCR